MKPLQKLKPFKMPREFTMNAQSCQNIKHLFLLSTSYFNKCLMKQTERKNVTFFSQLEMKVKLEKMDELELQYDSLQFSLKNYSKLQMDQLMLLMIDVAFSYYQLFNWYFGPTDNLKVNIYFTPQPHIMESALPSLASSRLGQISPEIQQASRITAERLRSSKSYVSQSQSEQFDAQRKIKRLEEEIRRAEQRKRNSESMINRQQSLAEDDDSFRRKQMEVQEQRTRMRNQIAQRGKEVQNEYKAKVVASRQQSMQTSRSNRYNDILTYRQNEELRHQNYTQMVEENKKIRERQQQEYIQAQLAVQNYRDNKQLQFIGQRQQLAVKNQTTGEFFKSQAQIMREREQALSQKLFQVQSQVQNLSAKVRGGK
ncbi:Hypothetical_protein [Hexamita inflata]|uniref:Hypothetical_protein n=1 Tax=Hexamita inflata TaxID=28002 RepID=A0ABP1GZF5_9EUKA